MSVSFDDRELRKLARDFEGAPRQLVRDVDDALDKRADQAANGARAAAPRNRPWLSTAAGFVVDTPEEFVRRIMSPRDPEGESVGYRIEFGTSVIAPTPMLVPAAREAQQDLNDDVFEALARATLP